MTAFIYRALELNMSIDVEIKVGKMRIHHLMGSKNLTKLSISDTPVNKSLYEHYLSKVGFSKVEISSKTITEKDIIYLIHQAKHLAELLDEVFTMEAIIFTPDPDTESHIIEMHINLVDDYMQLDVCEKTDSELLKMVNKDELNPEYDIVNYLSGSIGSCDLGNIKIVLETIDSAKFLTTVDKVSRFTHTGYALKHSSYLVLHDGKLTTVIDKESVDKLDNAIVLVGESQSVLNKYFADVLYGKFAKTLNACRDVSIPLAILAGNNYWYNIVKF